MTEKAQAKFLYESFKKVLPKQSETPVNMNLVAKECVRIHVAIMQERSIGDYWDIVLDELNIL